jgi:PAS domain S-box-containing protein
MLKRRRQGSIADRRPIAARRIARLEEANRRLRESEARFRSLFQRASVGMYEVDFVRRKMLAVNDYVLERTGYSREEFLALQPKDLLTPESARRFGRRLEKLMAGEELPQQVEFEVRLKDGSTLWTQLEVRFFHGGEGNWGAAVAVHDIDARYRAKASLVASERRFRTLVETMKEGLAIMDAQGRLTYVNDRILELGGYTREELLGRSVLDLLEQSNRLIFQRELTGAGGEEAMRPHRLEWEGGNGRRIVSIISPSLIRDDQGRVCGSFAVVTDITDLTRAEEALKLREQELREKNANLEETNTALRVLLAEREQDRTAIEQRLVDSIRQLLEPQLGRLAHSGLSDRQKGYLASVDATLQALYASFEHTLSPRFLKLTPAEIEVAHLVRHGKSTKEIARLLNISPRTADMHRLSIRRKLGVDDRRTSLRVFLMSI